MNKNAFQEIPSRFISTAANLRELVLDENFFSRIDLSFLNDLPHLKSLRSVYFSFWLRIGFKAIRSNITVKLKSWITFFVPGATGLIF